MKPNADLNNVILLIIFVQIITFNQFFPGEACSNEQIQKINTSLTPMGLLNNLKIISSSEDTADIVNLSKKYFYIPESFWKFDEKNGVSQVAFAKYYNRQIDESMPYRINIYSKGNTTKRQMVIGIYKDSKFYITPIMVSDIFGQPTRIFTTNPNYDHSYPTLVYRYEEQNDSKQIFPYGFEFTFINPTEHIFYRNNISMIDIENELKTRLDVSIHKNYNCRSIAFGNIHNPILYGD